MVGILVAGVYWNWVYQVLVYGIGGLFALGGSSDTTSGFLWSGSNRLPAGRLVLDTTVVPIPAAAWLFGSALLGLVGISRRKKLKA